MSTYRLLKMNSRGGRYYAEEIATGKRRSLKTADVKDAEKLLHAMNESERNPHLNYLIGQAYLSGSDPQMLTRTWKQVIDAIIELKDGQETKHRWVIASKDKAFRTILDTPLLKTMPEQLLRVLKRGTVSTNVYLRRIQNHAVDMGWLPKPVLCKKVFPKVHYKVKRAITEAEHRSIVAKETNQERRDFYELCWLLGGSQGDIANLNNEDIDWNDRLIVYNRQKLATKMQENSNLKPPMIKFGARVEDLLRRRPQTGPLFPYLKSVRAGDRATEFKQRCQGLNISGITLHSYRYAWAERARTAHYPQRCAQEVLGHQSAAVHRAYARNAAVITPSLDQWEQQVANGMVNTDMARN